VCEATTSSSYPNKASLPVHVHSTGAAAEPFRCRQAGGIDVWYRSSRRSIEGLCVNLRVAVLAPVAGGSRPVITGLEHSLRCYRGSCRGVDATLFASADSVTGARPSLRRSARVGRDAAVEPKVAVYLSGVRTGGIRLIHNSFASFH
jgi:hypothetical protein